MIKNFRLEEDGKLYWKVSPVHNATVGSEAGTYRKGYRSVKIKGTQFYTHRVVWYLRYSEWPSDQIDHINGVKDDNRVENLRVVSPGLNQRSYCKPRGGYSKYRGVSYHKSMSKWIAQVRYEGKLLYLGAYDSDKKAALRYNEAALELGFNKEALNMLSEKEF